VQTERSGNSAAAQDQTLFTPAVSLEGNGSRPSHHGDGYSESDTSYTLNSVEQHGVAYGIGRDSFNSGENAKFDMSLEEDIQPPITARGAGGVCSITQ